MKSVVRAILVAVGLALVLAFSSSAAASSGTWQLPAAKLSSTHPFGTVPRIAVSSSGATTVVWDHYENSGYVVEGATRPSGKSFGAAVNLSGSGSDANAPYLGSGPGDGFTTAWARADTPVEIGGMTWGTSHVQASTAPASGSFGAPVNVSATSPPTGYPATYPTAIATTPDGTTVLLARAVSFESPGDNETIQASIRPPGGSFGAPTDISTPSETMGEARIAVAPDGTVTAVWDRRDGGASHSTVEVATRPRGGSFSAPVAISAAGQDAERPQIASAPDGTTVVVWYQAGTTDSTIEAAIRPPGGSFGAPVTISGSGGQAFDPQVGIDENGAITVVWQKDGVIEAAARPPHGSFGGSVSLSTPGGSAENPRIAVANDGAAAVVWDTYKDPHLVVQAITRPAGGAFTKPVDLSALGQDAQQASVAIAPDGTATAVWDAGDDSTGYVVESASTGSSSPPPPPPAGKPLLKITKLTPRSPTVKRGGKVKLTVAFKDAGTGAATGLKLCLVPGKSAKKAVKRRGSGCVRLSKLGPGISRKATFTLKATRKAKKGRKYPFKLTLSAKGAKTVNLKVKVKAK